MFRRKLLMLINLSIMIAAVLFAAIDERLIVRQYVIESEQIDMPVRLAVLTDFHGCDYGPDGAELVARVAEYAPDAILLVGDMFSSDGDVTEELAMFRALDSIAFTCYVTGNHEFWDYDVYALCTKIHEIGVTVLDQQSTSIEVNGQRINFCGIADPYSISYMGAPDTEVQLANVAASLQQDAYTILLAHRPELIGKYAANGSYDLVVSGHAHGGQIRIPGLINGLYAPNQGWFPKYAGGRYEVEGTTLIVSRGLSKQQQRRIPRVFNRPELVIVDLE